MKIKKSEREIFSRLKNCFNKNVPNVSKVRYIFIDTLLIYWRHHVALWFLIQLLLLLLLFYSVHNFILCQETAGMILFVFLLFLFFPFLSTRNKIDGSRVKNLDAANITYSILANKPTSTQKKTGMKRKWGTWLALTKGLTATVFR